MHEYHDPFFLVFYVTYLKHGSNSHTLGIVVEGYLAVGGQIRRGGGKGQTEHRRVAAAVVQDMGQVVPMFLLTKWRLWNRREFLYHRSR